MSLIVDASVAVRWYLPEQGSEAAEAILIPDEPRVAPELVIAEIGNAVWKRLREREATAGDALEIIERAALDFSLLVPIGELAAAAMQHSAAFDHPIHDCFYVALARREGAALVNADARWRRWPSGRAWRWRWSREGLRE